MDKNTIVLKYGGNAMTDENIKKELIRIICTLKQKGHSIVIVHGGGPFIQNALQEAHIKSEFIAGQRKTSPKALEYVEMVLKGKVNGNIVGLINAFGHKAVGLSGKDGQLVIAKKRFHIEQTNGRTKQIDLGQVGDVEHVDASLLHLLLQHDYLPVITCLASDNEGNDYNINGDIFAGHIAGALKASEFIVLTDVDGLMTDINNPESLMADIGFSEIQTMIQNGTIKGGMIPKIEACMTAITKGAKAARIINGTKPEQLMDLIDNKQIGTRISL